LWTLVWFLIGGWVSTLLQIGLLIGIIYYFKYGWQRAPTEIWHRAQAFVRFFWNWLRAREPQRPVPEPGRQIIRIATKEFGDINVSTLLSLAVLAGAALLSQLQPA
jgi:hypothetical protein